MNLPQMMVWLEHQSFAIQIAESTWLFPLIETVHVIALSIVVGSVAIMDLRLLGAGSRERTVSEVISSTLPWTWTGFVLTVTAGSLLFSSRATSYYTNLPFRIKLVCLGLAGINMLVFHLFTMRGIITWDRIKTPVAAKIAGAISLALWIAIVTTGRWIGFV